VALLTTVSAEERLAAPQRAQEDLKRLSIEELMQIDVTTAGRREEPVATTAAAVSVITSEDIRRAGVTTIADALRLADGVHVARLNNGTWAISSRGFNVTSANKLLVMVDGRTVYSPLFTGVFWNVLDYVLDDIERIEVIRGPGATLWGANALNAVVNIITRHASATPGTLASVASGNEDPALVTLRHGTTTGAVAWRVYGKFASRDDQRLAAGGPAGDDRRRGQAGFRADGGRPLGTNWLLKGDLFHSRDSFVDRPDGEFSLLSLHGRWSAPLPRAARVDVQSYYQREYRRVPAQLTHRVDTIDVDAQYTTTLASRHHVVSGGTLRVNRDRTHGTAVLSFDPPSRTYAVAGVFAQDEITIVPGRLFTTVGAKYEHNAFSGGELQPSVRGRVTLPRGQTLWGAVSRGVRRPTRLDNDVRVFAPTGALIVTGDDFLSESLVALELGYRAQPSRIVSFDATLFRHRFDNLRSQDLPPTGPPIVVGNSLEGVSRGLEVGVNVQPVAAWRTHVGYTWLDTDVRPQPGSRDVGGGASEANDPAHLLGVRTAIDLPRRIQLDAQLRSVGALPDPRVPGYTELNVRVGWQAAPRVDIWLAGQDLLHGRHPEFGPATPARIEFERSVRAGITFRSSP
jgi:iron complex outermembrane receptor protein